MGDPSQDVVVEQVLENDQISSNPAKTAEFEKLKDLYNTSAA